MRVILIGQAAFGEKALELLHARGEQVAHVFAPPEPVSGGRPDPLKAKALALDVPLSQPTSFKGDAIFDQVKALDADLIVMAFVTLIVPERILFAPRLKTICFHPSLLPRHRGASAINWTLIHGDAETGISWFWPDRGIDTGPLLLQRRVAIGPDDTTGTLYFNTLFPLGIATLNEALDLVQSPSPPRLAQDESAASYEAICRDEHARIDFTRPARDVHNLIRGCDPQPGAYAMLDAQPMRLFEPHFDTGGAKGAAPGTIIALDAAGMRLALDGGTLLIRRARLESKTDPQTKKVAPAELAASGLRVGQQLD